jgi:magnesium transporter
VGTAHQSTDSGAARQDGGVIVDVATYRQGVRHPAGDWSDELAACRDAGEGFIWIGLKDPTHAELVHLSEELSLHALAIEDAVHGHQRPKVEQYEGSLFVVLKTLSYSEATSDVETGEIMLFVGDQYVVTVRRGDLHPLGDIRQRLDASAAALKHGPAVVLHAVMDSVVDMYLAIDDELQRDLDEIEASVFAPAADTDATRIYALKREVLEVRRAVVPLLEPAERLVQQEMPHIPASARPFFRDVVDHLLRTVDHVESYDRLLTDVLSAHLAQVSVRQNEDMRKISAWVAIAAVPTVIAAVYGMNFSFMPELGWRYGYFGVLAVMGGACASLYVLFKRSGWL